MYKCPLCGNIDQNLIGIRNDTPYCRKCIKYSNTNYITSSLNKTPKDINFYLKYPLSSFQESP